MASFYEIQENSFIHVQRRFDQIESDTSLLDATELERYERYLEDDKKAEFLAGRTFIKSELAKLYHVDASEIELKLSENGKPSCTREGEEQIHFNLSHGGGYFILALSLNPIGVDLEKKREVALEIIQPILSETEYNQLAGFPDEERSRAILSLFTKKEAFVKSTDKKYGLDEISFKYSDGYWELETPQVNCSLQHIEHKELIIAISIDLG